MRALPELALQRLVQQQLLSPGCKDPAEVVRWMGAVQAQDYLGALWGTGCRLPQATEAIIEQAIAERTIVRTWPMRGTIHFVPAEDARWMVELLARRTIGRMQGYFRKAGLDEAAFDRSREICVRALQGGKELTRRKLYDLLEAEGISTANSRGLFITGRLAWEGLICFGRRQGKQPTFVLLEEWVTHSRSLTPEEGLAELARRYFQSHGPATIQDFQWWTGLTAAEAQVGLEVVRSGLETEIVGGKTLWWGEPRLVPASDSGGVHLLPAYDEYLVSYKDRRAALDPDDTWLADPRRHLGPVIISRGQVIGTWKRTLKSGSAWIEATLARPLTGDENQNFKAAVQRYGAFLGLPAELKEVKLYGRQ